MVSKTDVPFHTSWSWVSLAELFDSILTWDIFLRFQACQNANQRGPLQRKMPSKFFFCMQCKTSCLLTPFVENAFAFHFLFRNSFLSLASAIGLLFRIFVLKVLNLRLFEYPAVSRRTWYSECSDFVRMSWVFPKLLRCYNIPRFPEYPEIAAYCCFLLVGLDTTQRLPVCEWVKSILRFFFEETIVDATYSRTNAARWASLEFHSQFGPHVFFVITPFDLKNKQKSEWGDVGIHWPLSRSPVIAFDE